MAVVTVDDSELRRIVRRHSAPYTALGLAFLRALGMQPSPPAGTSRRGRARRADPTRADVLDCMRQDHGVDVRAGGAE